MSDAKQFNIGGIPIMVKDAAARERLNEMDNNAYRSRNGAYLHLTDLGTSYTPELKEDIVSGTFKKAVVGGVLTINSHVYYLAHPDYWLNTGDTPCTAHHMLAVPAANLYNDQMHKTESGKYEAGAANTTDGGYVNSDMCKTGLTQALNIILSDFGEENILVHRELLINAVTNGKPSSGAWYDNRIVLMNEPMVYGSYIFTPACDGSTIPYLYTIDKSQIELFARRPDLICNRAAWWLRGVVSGAYFAYVTSYGRAYCGYASYSLGIRPAFGIC